MILIHCPESLFHTGNGLPRLTQEILETQFAWKCGEDKQEKYVNEVDLTVLSFVGLFELEHISAEFTIHPCR